MHFVISLLIPEIDMCINMKDVEVGKIVGRGSFVVVHHGRWRGKDVAVKKIRVPNSANVPGVPQ